MSLEKGTDLCIVFLNLEFFQEIEELFPKRVVWLGRAYFVLLSVTLRVKQHGLLDLASSGSFLNCVMVCRCNLSLLQ